MKTLELKHLAPYLPYGLKIHTQFGVNVPKNGHIYTVVGVCQKRTVFLDSDIVFEVEEKFNKELSNYYNEFKPLLRPLSDLTKEIEVDGQKFVPIVKLLKLAHPQYVEEHKEGRYSEIEYSFEGWYAKACFSFMATKDISIHTGFMWNVPYWIGEKLNEWHFDWKDDLIKDNLAIDLNTINQ